MVFIYLQQYSQINFDDLVIVTYIFIFKWSICLSIDVRKAVFVYSIAIDKKIIFILWRIAMHYLCLTLYMFWIYLKQLIKIQCGFFVRPYFDDKWENQSRIKMLWIWQIWINVSFFVCLRVCVWKISNVSQLFFL